MKNKAIFLSVFLGVTLFSAKSYGNSTPVNRIATVVKALVYAYVSTGLAVATYMEGADIYSKKTTPENRVDFLEIMEFTATGLASAIIGYQSIKYALQSLYNKNNHIIVKHKRDYTQVVCDGGANILFSICLARALYENNGGEDSNDAEAPFMVKAHVMTSMLLAPFILAHKTFTDLQVHR